MIVAQSDIVAIAQAAVGNLTMGVIGQLLVICGRAGAGAGGGRWVTRLHQTVEPVIFVGRFVAFGVGQRSKGAVAIIGAGRLVRLHACDTISGLRLGGLACGVIGGLTDPVGTVATRRRERAGGGGERAPC